MVHTTTQAMPMQLVFGRNAIMNLTFDANCNLIKQKKQRIINKNNEMENRKRVTHTYKLHDLQLLKNKNPPNSGKMPIMVLGQ